jgi:hypothetical protein
MVVIATERLAKSRMRGPRAFGELPSRIQQILDTSGLSFMLFPGLEVDLSELGKFLIASLPLKSGRRNPSRVRDIELVHTNKGVFAEAIAGVPTKDVPPFAFAVVATRFEAFADQYSRGPSWCTCDKDGSHKYEHSRYRNGDSCPQSDGGKLDCT